jgi:hypothetical protein
MTTSGNLQYSPVLTEISVGFENAGMLADMLFPPIPVDTETFKWMRFAASSAFDLYNNAANQDGEVPQVKSGGALVAGQVYDFALREPVNTLLEQASTQVGFSQKARVVKKLLGHQSLAREYRVLTALMTDGNYLASHLLTAGAGDSPFKWTNASATPIKDCLLMLDVLPVVPSGRRIAVFSQPAWVAFRTHPTVLDAVKYTGIGGSINTDAAKMLLGVDELHVSKAQIHTGAPNADEDALNLSYLMGDDVVFMVQPSGVSTPDMSQPAFAYTFRLRVNGQLTPVYTYEAPARGGHGSTWVQVACNEDNIIVGKIYGSRIKDTTA